MVVLNVGTRGFGRALALGLIGCVLWSGCSDEASKPSTGAGASRPPSAAPTPTTPPPQPAAQPTPALSHEQLVEAGRSVYNSNCIACHNMDPTKDGALGPAVAGSPLELIEARVMRAEYPDGYTPKRDTRVMVALPHLKPQLPALAAYLGSLE